MNAEERLTMLCGALALVMPTTEAVQHASLEWRMAHAAWFGAVESLGYSENKMREAALVGRAAFMKATTPAADTQVGTSNASEPKNTPANGDSQ